MLVSPALEREQGTFSLVMATGVLHHLDDERAARLYELARRALRPNGRLITYDGCFVPEQSKTARWLLSHDRGKFVRTREAYLRLASARSLEWKPICGMTCFASLTLT